MSSASTWIRLRKSFVWAWTDVERHRTRHDKSLFYFYLKDQKIIWLLKNITSREWTSLIENGKQLKKKSFHIAQYFFFHKHHFSKNIEDFFLTFLKKIFLQWFSVKFQYRFRLDIIHLVLVKFLHFETWFSWQVMN